MQTRANASSPFHLPRVPQVVTYRGRALTRQLSAGKTVGTISVCHWISLLSSKPKRTHRRQQIRRIEKASKLTPWWANRTKISSSNVWEARACSKTQGKIKGKELLTALADHLTSNSVVVHRKILKAIRVSLALLRPISAPLTFQTLQVAEPNPCLNNYLLIRP